MTDISHHLTSLKDFIPLNKLGEGSFSTVYKVKRLNDNKIYALKKIKINQLKEKDKNNALNQIRILASFQCKYVISYKQAFYDSQLGLLCIVMQYANQGDLQKRIQNNKSKNQLFQQTQIWRAISNILMGLKELHQKGILHRDLKSANVFISDKIYKLGDLNVSKINHHNEDLAYTQTGTPYYASPQVWRDEPYNHKSDIWSFGCMIYQMCTFHPPFKGQDLDQLYKSVQKGKFTPISASYSTNLYMFIYKCLQIDPNQRPSAKQLLNFIPKQYKNASKVNSKIETSQYKLMKTIKFPFNIKDLSQSLPIAKYQIQNYQLTDIKQKAQLIQLAQRYKTQDKQNFKQKQKRDILSLPQKIKQHLLNIPSKQYQKNIRPQSRAKTANKAQSRNKSCQKRLFHIQKKAVELLNCQNYSKNYRINADNVKRRPFSCNLNKKAQLSQNKKYEQINQNLHKQLNNDTNIYEKYQIQKENISNIRKVGYIKQYNLKKFNLQRRTHLRKLQSSECEKSILQKKCVYNNSKNFHINNSISKQEEMIRQRKLRCFSANLIKENNISYIQAADLRLRLQNRKNNLMKNRKGECFSENKIKPCLSNCIQQQLTYKRIITDPRIKPIVNKNKYNFQRIQPIQKQNFSKAINKNPIKSRQNYQNSFQQKNNISGFLLEKQPAYHLIMNDVSNLRKALKSRHININKIH